MAASIGLDNSPLVPLSSIEGKMGIDKEERNNHG